MKRREFLTIPATAPRRHAALHARRRAAAAAGAGRQRQCSAALLLRRRGARRSPRPARAFSPATRPAPAPPKPAWSSILTASLPDPTAATNIATRKARGSNRCRSTAIRARKRRAKSIAQGLATLGADFADPAGRRAGRRTALDREHAFFQMLRTHTIEGMFCDPMHGGNAGLIGWQLIGFPGPRMSYRDEIDKYHGMPYRPKPVSLQQVVGHPVKGWEEES